MFMTDAHFGERWRHCVEREQLTSRSVASAFARVNVRCNILRCTCKYIYILQFTSHEPESIVLRHLFVTCDSDNRRARIGEKREDC